MSEYKQTEIGRIPQEWEVVKLGEVVKDILTGATPLRSNREYWLNGNIPWLTNEEVEDEKINYIWKTKEKVTEKALKETNIKLIPENSVILSLTASVGKVAINKIPITTNQQFNSFIIDFNEIYPEFLGYYFIFAKKRIEMLAGTTTFRFISKSKIANFKIPLPPFTEQQKIAGILSTVDEAIEKVDSAIVKTERLKKGLMKELLTKGIDHKEFKDTEIGRIPKEWEVVRLKESKEIDLIMGQSPPGKSYNKKGEGVPFIQGKAEFGNMYPSPILWTAHPIKKAKEGDILISVRAPVGDVNICPYRLCIGRGLAAIRIKEGSNIFYFYWFQKEKQRIESIGKGSTFKAITKDELSNIFIPFPSLPEQQKIAEILSTVDKRLELLRNKKEKMERVKKGLMNDLLTGKRRVKV